MYPNSTLVGDADEMQALLDNKVQMLAPSLSSSSSIRRSWRYSTCPSCSMTTPRLRFQKREASRELLRSMAGRGIYGLAYWNNGLKQMTASQPLRNPADAAGHSLPYPALAGARGAVRRGRRQGRAPAVLRGVQGHAERHGAGNRGPWSNLRGQSAAGKPSYVTETNHGVLNYMLVANSEFWTSIPFALRSELENIVLEVTQTVNAEAAAINQREREQLIASGSATLVTLTPEQRQAWRTKMQPVWKSFESQIGADIMRAALTVNRR